MIQVLVPPADIDLIVLKPFSMHFSKRSKKESFLMRFMFRKFIPNLILASVILLLGSCSTGEFEFQARSFKSRLQEGDYHLGWSLNYFDSWRNARQPRYLRLAESHSINAINSFARLESDTSPRISEFYVVRERRTRGCRLLAELQFEASNHGHNLSGMTPQGCIY